MAYSDTLTMTYPEAYAEMMFGTIVESDHILYKLHEGQLLACSIIGLATWLKEDPKKIEHLMFKKFDKSEFKKQKPAVKLQYLVINQRQDASRLPYAEQYKLFTEPQDAIDYAISLGFNTMFGLPDLDKVGMMAMSQVGMDKVSILPVAAV